MVEEIEAWRICTAEAWRICTASRIQGRRRSAPRRHDHGARHFIEQVVDR
jgi:hypothetical protein